MVRNYIPTGRPHGVPPKAERNAAILRLHTEGSLTFTMLANRFGISPQRCHQIVARDQSRAGPRASSERRGVS